MAGADVVRTIKLKPVELTPENWKPFGQIVAPCFDGKAFDSDDAKLDLSCGTPRLYIMRLEKRSCSFDSITHHASVTQCLGSIGGLSWYLAVAPPSVRQITEVDTEKGADAEVVRAKSGHSYVPPSPADVQVFRVDGPRILKLHTGTWHAGPLFKDESMDFLNLELSDTNEVDRHMHVFREKNRVTFEIED